MFVLTLTYVFCKLVMWPDAAHDLGLDLWYIHVLGAGHKNLKTGVLS